MDILTQKYLQVKNYSSDINEHIEIFANYSKDCSHVVELGVRSVVSSWGFLYGLRNSLQENKKLTGIDLVWDNNINILKSVAEENNIEYEFRLGNSLHINIEPTDILFIDTWHVYGQLKRELSKHQKFVKKYIIMHDTEVDKLYGECRRANCNVDDLSLSTGIPKEEITKGLIFAIQEFLSNNHEWNLHEVHTNNNGLTILKRTGY